MNQIWKELRYAARLLRRSPGFAGVALLVLAVGIGANTAVFSVVYNVLLKPLNYRDPSGLVVVLCARENPVSPADYLDYRAQATAFESLEAAQGWGGSIETANGTEMITGLQVSAGMFAMLGATPERGRWFRPGEDQPGASPVVIISHKVWEQRLGSDPNIIGRTLSITGQPFTVVGVMPRGFQFAPFWITQAEMWSPLDLSKRAKDRDGRSLRVFARLKPGVKIEQAAAQMKTIAGRLATEYPQTNTGITAEVTPLLQIVTGPVRPTLIVLLATVAFLLMIACANIANLLLTRAIGRRREIAVRLAIGAARWQLIRQLATESLLLSVLGGIAGILVASWSLSLLPHVLPPASLPRLGEVGLNRTVLLFAAAASVVTGLISGLFPALESSRVDVSENLKQGGRGSSGGPQPRTRGLLIAAEVSLALVLLVCAGLMIRTLSHLTAVNAGFNPNRLLTMYVFTPPGDTSPEQRITVFRRVADAIAAVPGVQSVSAINHLPISGDVWTLGYSIPGRPAPPPGQGPSAVYRVIRPGYFQTMQIPLIAGREFTEHDNAHSTPVVIISERLARDQWPGRNPVGQAFEIPQAPADPHNSAPQTRFTIVGVAGNVRQSGWTAEPNEEYYLPYLQRADAWDQGHEAFVIRTVLDPKAIAQQAADRVHAVDPHVAISDLMPMDEIIGDKLWRSRLAATLLAGFGAIALILATVGIYGVIAYSVRQRRQEIGIRVALGATRWNVLGLALRESMGSVGAGLVIGLVLASAVTRWLAALLYGVERSDPSTFALVVIGLLATSAAATVIPTWRAMSANVVSALRDE